MFHVEQMLIFVFYILIMRPYFKKHFVKLTPLFFVAGVGAILSAIGLVNIWFSYDDHGGLGIGILAILLLMFCAAFVLDRYLVGRYTYKGVVIGEAIVLLVLPFLYLFLNKETDVIFKTEHQYVAVLYADGGLCKDQIPRSGLFNRKIVVEVDSLLRLNIGLINDDDFGLTTPSSWGGYFQKSLDTIIAGKPYHLHLYYNKISEDERGVIFERYMKLVFAATSGIYPKG